MIKCFLRFELGLDIYNWSDLFIMLLITVKNTSELLYRKILWDFVEKRMAAASNMDTISGEKWYCGYSVKYWDLTRN